MATLAAVTNLPALALLDEDGRLEHSSEPFRCWYADREELCKQSPEFQRVLDGQANAAVLNVDGIAVDIAAVSDRAGARRVLVTLPTGELPSLGDPGGALLDGALDESPALVWLKDLEGRYVRVNSRFTTLLGTTEERLLGRTDAEIPPAETVDGPRLERAGDLEEPLQLEYFVGPYHGRDALAVLRFPVGDANGVPVLVCGVAAPSSEANVARAEAARLLRIERWSRLDAGSVRAEMLAEWGVLPVARGRAMGGAGRAMIPEQTSPPSDREQQAAVAEARAERAAAVAERDAALTASDGLAAALEAAKARLKELERTHAAGDVERGDAEMALAARAADLERALERERDRAEQLERTLALVRERLGDDADAARTEVQRARADADAARTEVQRARADAESARGDLDKARVTADAARAAVAAEHDAGARTREALELQVRQARERVVSLEHQQGADDSGAQLLKTEKALAGAEAALAEAVAERDATLKARAALEGEIELERKQVTTLHENAAAADRQIRELTGDVERERVRAATAAQLQARVQELEGELRVAMTRAEKAEREVEFAATAADKAEQHLRYEVARADQAERELRLAVARADKLEGELHLAQSRVQKAESDAHGAAGRAIKAEGEGEQWRTRAIEAEAGLAVGNARGEGLDGELARARSRLEQLDAELRLATTRADDAGHEIELGRARADHAEHEIELGRARADHAELEIELGRARVDELSGEIERGAARVEELEGELERRRAQTEEADAAIAELEQRLDQIASDPDPEPVVAEDVEPVAAEHAAPVLAEVAAPLDPGDAAPPEHEGGEPSEPVGAEPPLPAGAPDPAAPAAELARLDAVGDADRPQATSGVSWEPTAKRALSASLARESVWRNVLKETVQVLGSEGGWDTVTAWLPDESDGLGCAATWTAHRGLDDFEALTWEAGVRREGSLLDQALQAPHLTWLTDIDAVDDERLQTAAAHGMSSALLLPVRNGATTIGLLELLTHDSVEPDAQIAFSLEASALQLGRFGHLLSLGK